jgi:CHAT domain-containing protein
MASIIELEVAAGPADGQFIVRVVRSAGDGEPTATMQLDTAAYLAALEDLETIVLASASAGRRILSPGEQRLRDIGRQLFDALFSGPVHEAYRASVSAADQRGERLQVVLRLDVPELSAIPWEAMYDAENDQYICLNDPLIRHIPSTTAEPVEVTSSLEVLALVASPDGLTTLDVEAERKKLSDALAEPIADGRIHLKWLMQASWDEVQDEMLSGTWHVLHFIGHGDYDLTSDQGVIALVGDDGGPHLVEADRLADLLNQATPTPRLVVLNSCKSGRSGASDLFSSTAATLVKRGIDAVAAMQFTVSDAGATKFARGFYSALANGRGIGDAVGAGRVGLRGTPGSLEWVTPVLYVRDDTATLFRITSPPPPAAPPPAQPARKRLSTATLAAIGGIAAAVVAVLVVVLVNVFSPEPKQHVAPPPTSSTSHTAATVGSTDADTVIQQLADVGVDYTVPRGQMVRWLNNARTPYPSLAEALVDLLGKTGLQRPVAIDGIAWNYEELAPRPRRLEEVDYGKLRAAVLSSFNERYGEQVTDFESLLKPAG